MKKKALAIPLLIIVLAAAGASWYYYTGTQKSSDGKIEGSGTIEAVELNIGSQIAAEVTSLKVNEGSTVKKGDLLLTLDDRALNDQVAIAQAGVDSAKATLDNADTATDKKVAQAQLDQAQANLSMAKTQQAYAAISSPVDGVVLSLPLLEGEMASPGTTLAVIGKTSELNLVIYVDEKELGKVKTGQAANVTVDAYSNDSFKGKVAEIASSAEFTPQNVQTKEQRSNLVFAVTIRVENPKGLLKPGMPADAVLD